MIRRLSLLFLLLCFCQLTFAGGRKGNVLKKLGLLIDNSTRKGIDSTYIIVPEKPWQLILQNNVNQTTYNMKATLFYDPEDTRNRIVFEPTLTTGVGWSTGLWLGYRGYGFGFQKSISDNSDYDLELSVGNNSYGLDFRLRHYDASKMDMHFVANLPDEDNNSYHFVENVEKVELESPISYKTLIIEGYYIFNGKHYSNSAVFDQSVQQVKSAGSLVAGATWFSSTVNYANLKSATIIDFMNNVGKTKQWQFSIGAG